MIGKNRKKIIKIINNGYDANHLPIFICIIKPIIAILKSNQKDMKNSYLFMDERLNFKFKYYCNIDNYLLKYIDLPKNVVNIICSFVMKELIINVRGHTSPGSVYSGSHPKGCHGLWFKFKTNNGKIIHTDDLWWDEQIDDSDLPIFEGKFLKQKSTGFGDYGTKNTLDKKNALHINKQWIEKRYNFYDAYTNYLTKLEEYKKKMVKLSDIYKTLDPPKSYTYNIFKKDINIIKVDLHKKNRRFYINEFQFYTNLNKYGKKCIKCKKNHLYKKYNYCNCSITKCNICYKPFWKNDGIKRACKLCNKFIKATKYNINKHICCSLECFKKDISLCNKCQEKKNIEIMKKQKKEEKENISKRYYFRIPYKDKDDAKNLGAKWNSEIKLWYAPNNNIKQKLKNTKKWSGLGLLMLSKNHRKKSSP